MNKKGNFFGTQKSSKNTSILRPPSLKPPPTSSSLRPPTKPKPAVVSKTDKKQHAVPKISTVASLVVGNYERTKLSKDDFISLFTNISEMKNKKIDDIIEIIEFFNMKDNENSFESEILNYMVQNYTYLEIKFIASLFIKTEIPTLGLFFEKFFRNKDVLLEVMSIAKFIKKFDIEDKNYVEVIKEFGKNNNVHQYLFNEISELKKNLIYSFFQGYINQGTYLLNDYYKQFVKENKSEILSLEKEKKQKKIEEHQKYLKRIEDSKIFKDIKIKNEKFEACKSLYKKVPWISTGNNIIKKILISKPTRTTRNENNTVFFEDFIIPESRIIIRDEEWYEVSEKYFQIQCDETINKTQENNVTSFYSNVDGSFLISLQIAFMISNNDFIEQNDVIFNSEKTFFSNLDTKLNDVTVNRILDNFLTDDIFNIGKNLFENALSKISLTSKYYSDVNIFKGNNSITIRQFANSLAEVIVYFDLEDIGDSIYKKRIQKEYYNRNVLFNLSIYEKLPEILCNNDDPNYISLVRGYIDYKISNFIYRFGETIYIITNKFSQEYKRKEFPNENNKLSIKYKTLNEFCNSDINILPEDLILYTHQNNNKHECFVLKDVIKTISNNETIYNNKNFSEHITRIYDFEQILNPKSDSSKDFPLVKLIIQDILNLDDEFDRFTLETNLGLFKTINENQEKDEEEDEEEEDEEVVDEEDDEDLQILEKGRELNVLNDDEEENEDDDEDDDEEKNEKVEDEEYTEDEDEEKNEKVEDEEDEEVDDDKDFEDEDTKDDNEEEEEEEELKEKDEETEEDEEEDTEDEENEIFEKEKLKKKNKFNDYSGVSETFSSTNDKFFIERNNVKGDGNCFFRSLYLAIIHNNPKNFHLIPRELRPVKLICEKNNFTDVDEFSKKCRQYISNNYDDMLNNIIEMGGFMSDDEIYPNSEDALFGEAGRCYINYRGNKNFKKDEIVDVKHENVWKKGKIKEIENSYEIYSVDDDVTVQNILSSNISKIFKKNDIVSVKYKNKWKTGKIVKIKTLNDDSNKNKKVYKIKLDDEDKIIKNISANKIIKKEGGKHLKKNEIVHFKYGGVWKKGKISNITKYNELDYNDRIYIIKLEDNDDVVIKNILSGNIMKKGSIEKFFSCAKKQIMSKSIYPTNGEIDIITNLLSENFEIKNIILPNLYNIKHEKSKVETNVSVRNILDENKNVRNSFEIGDKVFFRKNKFIKGVISKDNKDQTYDIKTKNKNYESIKLKNILDRSENQLTNYKKGDKVLFRSLFKKGKIVDVSSDCTLNDNLTEESKEKITNDIEIYEQNKNRDKIQVYLLTDNCHYNFLGYEEDHLETLELNKDGNFTDNLLKYLDGKKINEDKEENVSDDEVQENDSDEEQNVSDDEVQENDSDEEQNDGDQEENDGDQEENDSDDEVQENDGEVYISSDSDNDNYNDGNKSVGDSKSCEKCKVRIKSSMKKFTSKNFNDKTNKIETIYFCCINCFKDFEKWIK